MEVKIPLMKIDGKIHEKVNRSTNGFHWLGKGPFVSYGQAIKVMYDGVNISM